MAVKFGRAKHDSRITLGDFLRHPIWVSAHDDRHDEEWCKPVVEPDSVTLEVLQVDNPIITLRVVKPDTYATGYYDSERDRVYGIALWLKGKRVLAERAKGIDFPLTLVAVPKILGRPDSVFVLRSAKFYHATRKRA